MLRPVANPPNPFLAAELEWLDEPPNVELQVTEETARSILSENDSPDLSFRWSVNPYRGCQHACAYCYARPTHEYLGLGAGTDFDSRITVKLNAAELLEHELSRPKWRRERIAFSGVTDCYQPLEAIYRLTRGCLEACHRRRTPVSIVTKSYLVVRDLDLLVEMHRGCGAHVNHSIAFASDEIARQIEPYAPPPSRRFEAMRRLSAAGVPVSIFAAPLIPGLNDRDIPALLERACLRSAAGGLSPLRLPGSVRDVFLERLRTALPDHAARVEARIRDVRGGALNESRFGERMKGRGTYWESIKRLFEMSAARHGLATRHGDGAGERADLAAGFDAGAARLRRTLRRATTRIMARLHEA